MIVEPQEPPNEYLLWEVGVLQFRWGWMNPNDPPGEIYLTSEFLQYAFDAWKERNVRLPVNVNHDFCNSPVSCDLQLRAGGTQLWLCPIYWPAGSNETEMVRRNELRYTSPEFELVWDEQETPAPATTNSIFGPQESVINRKLVGIVLSAVALTNDPATLNCKPLLSTGTEVAKMTRRRVSSSQQSAICLSRNIPKKELEHMASKKPVQAAAKDPAAEDEKAPAKDPIEAASDAVAAAKEPAAEDGAVPPVAKDGEAAPVEEAAAAPAEGDAPPADGEPATDPESAETSRLKACMEAAAAALAEPDNVQKNAYIGTIVAVLQDMEASQTAEVSEQQTATVASMPATSPAETEVETGEIAKLCREIYGDKVDASALRGILVAREADHAELQQTKATVMAEQAKATQADIEALRGMVLRAGASEATLAMLLKSSDGGASAMRSFLSAREAKIEASEPSRARIEIGATPSRNARETLKAASDAYRTNILNRSRKACANMPFVGTDKAK